MEAGELTIRDAGPADLEFCYQVKEESFRRYSEAIRPWDSEFEKGRIQRMLEANQVSIVALAGTESAFYSVENVGDALVIHNLFVLNAFQSRRIGSNVVSHLKTIGFGLGVPLRLRVLRHNTRAVAFYLREGFCEESVTETHLRLVSSCSQSD